MATATLIDAPASSSPVDHTIHLPGVGWEGYQTILRLRGDRPSPRLLYLDGDLTLMSPSMPHECHSRLLGRFVPEVAAGLGLPCSGIGSTRLGREVLNVGVEGDQVFYLDSLAAVRGKVKLDLNVDPPPDLAIEVVVTHGAEGALEVYRRLGVPEVWVFTLDRLAFLRLGEDGTYAESAESRAFSMLRADEVFGWVDQPPLTDESEWSDRLRAWVRDVLVPRVRGIGGHRR